MTAPLLRVRPRCRTLQPRAKVPLYVMLAISLSFAVSFSLVDLLNLYYDRCCPCAPPRSTPLVSTPAQVIRTLPHHGVVRHIMSPATSNADLVGARVCGGDGRGVRAALRSYGRGG